MGTPSASTAFESPVMPWRVTRPGEAMTNFDEDGGSSRTVGVSWSRASHGTTIVLAGRVSVSPERVKSTACTVRNNAASPTTRISPTTTPALPRMTWRPDVASIPAAAIPLPPDADHREHAGHHQ
jgi:hypothetical protein